MIASDKATNTIVMKKAAGGGSEREGQRQRETERQTDRGRQAETERKRQ